MLVTVHQDQQYTLTVLCLADRALTPFADARSTAMINAVFSPDGRWIAHQGRDEASNVIFVAPFPDRAGTKYMILRLGGHPAWSSTNQIVANVGPQRSAIIQMTTEPVFSFGNPVEFPRAARSEPNPATEARAVDFRPGGERLMGVLTPGPSGVFATNELIVVLNWLDELGQRVAKP